MDFKLTAEQARFLGDVLRLYEFTAEHEKSSDYAHTVRESLIVQAASQGIYRRGAWVL
jgi:hypothetical protein